ENWEDETEDEIEQQSRASPTRSSSEASKISPAIPTETVSNVKQTMEAGQMDVQDINTQEEAPASQTEETTQNNTTDNQQESRSGMDTDEEDGHTTDLETLMQEEK
ncbi:15823_t:CDS:2, partial [Cetraspora pellucida]